MDEIVAWMAKDKKYLSVVDDEERRKRIGKEVQEGVIGRPKWWENEPGGMVISGGAKFDVVWPSHRRKLREERRGRKEVRFPMEYKLEQSATPEVLVPVRIDLEFEHYRLRDTFVWNMHDPVVTPEQFALATCQDFDLPLSAAPLIGKSIQEQLQEFKSLTHPTAGRGDNEEHAGWMEEEDDEWGWWEGWRKKLKLGEAGEYVGVNPIIEEPPVLPVEPTKPAVTEDASQEVKMETEGEVKQEEVEVIDVDKTPEEKLQVPERAVTPHEELRILIKLDILVGSKHLVDQFEWDTNDPLNSPEVFAEIYASDLGLGGEFKYVIFWITVVDFGLTCGDV
ncbi:SWI/SNF chromatin-remodeling complex subunit [Tulasnella sp. 419]|nr:SWI/SNF chromatin-remodeling complex subunit [Tulasnella sp. 419]